MDKKIIDHSIDQVANNTVDTSPSVNPQDILVEEQTSDIPQNPVSTPVPIQPTQEVTEPTQSPVVRVTEDNKKNDDDNDDDDNDDIPRKVPNPFANLTDFEKTLLQVRGTEAKLVMAHIDKMTSIIGDAEVIHNYLYNIHNFKYLQNIHRSFQDRIKEEYVFKLQVLKGLLKNNSKKLKYHKPEVLAKSALAKLIYNEDHGLSDRINLNQAIINQNVTLAQSSFLQTINNLYIKQILNAQILTNLFELVGSFVKEQLHYSDTAISRLNAVQIKSLQEDVDHEYGDVYQDVQSELDQNTTESDEDIIEDDNQIYSTALANAEDPTNDDF